jgi:enamine deaminase RidA (YjgF/YER057c/UK114 family)
MFRGLLISTVLLGTVAPVLAQPLQRTNPPGLSTPRTYSHVVRAGKLLFIAGQVGVDEKGAVAGPTMAAQLDRALTNLEIALKSQGADLTRLAKITVYTTSVAEFISPEAVAVRDKHMSGNFPASTLVQIQQLARPEFKVEIEGIAVLP